MDNKPNPKANILVRNLAPAVTQKAIHAHFSKFGEIQKCKLECFADGLSRGFAYVQYTQEKDAAEAIKATNGAEFEGKKLEVFSHVKRVENADEQSAKQSQQGNNIFVQGFQKGTDEKTLRKMFDGFGEITSLHFNKADSDDALQNSVYVCFKTSQSAHAAVEKMNKTKMQEGSYLLVNHHVAKRQNELATDKTKTAINQNINKNFSSNLFVKFIPTHIGDEELQKLFGQYGNIISIKLKVKDTGRFNHAYVLYESVEMCQQAIRNLDKTRPFGNNQPIDVEFWVSKVDLQAEREAKQKEQMQKFFSSAIYEIKNELGGRKPFRRNNNNRHPHHQAGGQRQGQTQGRGGKPMASSERKNSKDNQRVKSQNKDKQAPAQNFGQATPAQNFVQVPLPNAQQVQALAAISDIQEKKQCVGNMIYPCIQQAYG